MCLLIFPPLMGALLPEEGPTRIAQSSENQECCAQTLAAKPSTIRPSREDCGPAILHHHCEHGLRGPDGFGTCCSGVARSRLQSHQICVLRGGTVVETLLEFNYDFAGPVVCNRVSLLRISVLVSMYECILLLVMLDKCSPWFALSSVAP